MEKGGQFSKKAREMEMCYGEDTDGTATRQSLKGVRKQEMNTAKYAIKNSNFEKKNVCMAKKFFNFHEFMRSNLSVKQ